MGLYVASVRKRYAVNASGTFGVLAPGQSRKRVVATVYRPNPERSARSFYRLARMYGAVTEEVVDKQGRKTMTAFFTRDAKITFRPVSTSDLTPTVTIYLPQPSFGLVRYQHLHFQTTGDE